MQLIPFRNLDLITELVVTDSDPNFQQRKNTFPLDMEISSTDIAKHYPGTMKI